MQMMKNGGNPQAMVQNMLMQDPKYSSIMSVVNQQYGGDAKAAFYGECERMGVDPNQVINMLK